MAKTIGHNLSRGVTIYLRFRRDCELRHDDVDAFHAPSECHGLVNKSNEREFRHVRRWIKGVTGLRWRVFEREVRRRTTGKFCYIYGI